MRRWTSAMLAALAVGASTLATLALAGSAGFGQEVSLPARHVGDRAEYQVLDAAGTLVGRLRVEQVDPFAARGADGRWNAVEGLRQTFLPAEAWAGDDPNALAERIVETWTTASGMDLAIRLAGGNQTYTSWDNRYNDVNVAVDTGDGPPNVFVAPAATVFGPVPAGEGPWCGLRNGAQGPTVAVRDGLIAPDCASRRLEWQGRAASGGGEVHRFGAGKDKVWIAEGMPYPVRIETQRLDGARILDLVGFLRGTAPPDLSSVAVPSADGLPAVDVAPRTPTGPDVAGTDHPFPLATALERARTYSVPPGMPPFNSVHMTEFLQAHPRAQVAAASYFEHTDTEWTLRTWRVALVDGPASVTGSISAEYREPEAGPLAPVAWSSLSPVRGGLLLRDDGPEGPWPPLERWPAMMPTVASVTARWEAVKDPLFDGKAATGYGFRIGCADPACSEVVVEVTAGRLRFQQPPEPFVEGPVGLPGGEAVDADGQVLAVDGEGQATALLSIYRREAPFEDGQLLLPGVAPAASVADRTAPAWDLPPVGYALGGALAVAAALAFWLWPTLKAASASGSAGGLGLFSRTEDGLLLEHKGRSAIVGAVEADPGLHFQELSRRTGIAAGALRHHLRKLEAAGLVAARSLGGYSCYFPPRQAEDKALQATAMAKSPGAQQVLAAWRGGMTGVRAIAAATGLSPSTVSHHLARLREAGLLPLVSGTGQAAA